MLRHSWLLLALPALVALAWGVGKAMVAAGTSDPVVLVVEEINSHGLTGLPAGTETAGPLLSETARELYLPPDSKPPGEDVQVLVVYTITAMGRPVAARLLYSPGRGPLDLDGDLVVPGVVWAAGRARLEECANVVVPDDRLLDRLVLEGLFRDGAVALAYGKEHVRLQSGEVWGSVREGKSGVDTVRTIIRIRNYGRWPRGRIVPWEG